MPLVLAGPRCVQVRLKFGKLGASPLTRPRSLWRHNFSRFCLPKTCVRSHFSQRAAGNSSLRQQHTERSVSEEAGDGTDNIWGGKRFFPPNVERAVRIEMRGSQRNQEEQSSPSGSSSQDTPTRVIMQIVPANS